MKPNRRFELSVKDIQIIEIALRTQLSDAGPKEKTEINRVLGKIHEQKNWYRPKGIYVSG